MVAWINLFVAGILEIIWAISLKYSNGLTNIVPSIVTIVGMIASFYFLALAVKTLPIGTSYAIWTGIGAIGTVILGMILFHEDISIIRIVFLIMVLGGIIGLKVTA